MVYHLQLSRRWTCSGLNQHRRRLHWSLRNLTWTWRTTRVIPSRKAFGIVLCFFLNAYFWISFDDNLVAECLSLCVNAWSTAIEPLSVKKGRPVDKPIDRNWWRWCCWGCEKVRQKWLRCPEWSITVKVGLLQVLHRVNKGAPEQVCAEIDNEE